MRVFPKWLLSVSDNLLWLLDGMMVSRKLLIPVGMWASVIVCIKCVQSIQYLDPEGSSWFWAKTLWKDHLRLHAYRHQYNQTISHSAHSQPRPVWLWEWMRLTLLWALWLKWTDSLRLRQWASDDDDWNKRSVAWDYPKAIPEAPSTGRFGDVGNGVGRKHLMVCFTYLDLSSRAKFCAFYHVLAPVNVVLVPVILPEVEIVLVEAILCHLG